MKVNKLVYVLLMLFGIGILLTIIVLKRQETPEDQRAKQIILTYIEAKALDIHPGTEQYARFMKGILLGEYPELTGENSAFIKNQDELSYVLKYAGENMYWGIERLFRRKYQEPDIEEANPPSE